MSSDFRTTVSSSGQNTIVPGYASASFVPHRIVPAISDRLQLLASISPAARNQVDELLVLAGRGLPRMHKHGSFGHTLRAVQLKSRWTERLEGESLRYTAMVALGLACTDEAVQRQVLDFTTAADLARMAAARAETSSDFGAIALSAWAAAEAGHFHAATLFQRLADWLASGKPIATVQCAWALTAALAARPYGENSDVAELARDRLFEARSASGLFPHMLPASASGRMRSHIACFADQVYPIQALARLHAAEGDATALSLADACAARICTLQGPDGQWWWHYDTRSGQVAEGYPVYSVHQHAMGPMALLDLREAGGHDYHQPIIKGLRWLDSHPEVVETLVVPEKGVVWRKVARREPNKVVRKLAALTTAISPRLRVPAVDTIFPPSRIDYECRPYELGWLLYAWLAGGIVAKLANPASAPQAGSPKEV